MKYAYLFAVIGNRLVALAGVIILSYLLVPASFGLYTLAATNALLTQILFGQWIAVAANKHIAIGGSEPDRATVSTLAAAMAGYAVLMAAIAAVYAAYPIAHATAGQVAIALGWSTALMLYEATLASKNALGYSTSYAALALWKNFSGSGLAILFVLAGYDALGAMFGQIIGTLIPFLLLRSSTRIWRGARLAHASKSLMLKMLRFGVGGTLSLGLYMLFNAISRNMVGYFLGEAEAGYLSLASDIFFGPLALIGSAYSLSTIPSLYIVEAEGDPERRRERISNFIHMNLYLAIPYAIGGAILAADIATAILPGGSRSAVANVAGAVAVQSAVMLMLCAITAILLIFNRRAILVTAVLGMSALNCIVLAVALSRGFDLPAAAWLSTIILGVVMMFLMGDGVVRRFMRLDLRMLVRIAIAAGAMGLTVWVYNRILFPGEPFGAVLIGGAVYLGLTAWMGVHYLNELVPERRRTKAAVGSFEG